MEKAGPWTDWSLAVPKTVPDTIRGKCPADLETAIPQDEEYMYALMERDTIRR